MGSVIKREMRHLYRPRHHCSALIQGPDLGDPDDWWDVEVSLYYVYCDLCGSFDCAPAITSSKAVGGSLEVIGVLLSAILVPIIGIPLFLLGGAMKDKYTNEEPYHCRKCGHEWWEGKRSSYNPLNKTAEDIPKNALERHQRE